MKNLKTGKYTKFRDISDGLHFRPQLLFVGGKVSVVPKRDNIRFCRKVKFCSYQGKVDLSRACQYLADFILQFSDFARLRAVVLHHYGKKQLSSPPVCYDSA